ncbi:MAG TPA: Hsp20/alpha crystallin family protein [Gaiellaceae bacterium]|nr:Hsp20/alpha crystallin family protein [Gaiellaceae bacterium]
MHEQPCEYVVQFDVSEFAKSELTVEATGRRVTVRGDQQTTGSDEGQPFRLHERLEESFRLPDDADVDQLTATYVYGVLELHAPRVALDTRRLPIGQPSFLANTDAAPC